MWKQIAYVVKKAFASIVQRYVLSVVTYLEAMGGLALMHIGELNTTI